MSNTHTFGTREDPVADDPREDAAGDEPTLMGLTKGQLATLKDILESVDFAQVTEDEAAAANPTGTPLMARRRDTLTTAEVSNDGDVIAVNADSKGQLYVNTSGSTAVAGGDVAHDAVDSGNPIKIGHKAIAHGTNPTAVAAGDRTDSYANRHGIGFVIGGHPNIITRCATISDGDGAQTDLSLLTVASGKIVITQIGAKADADNTGTVSVRIGFGTANVPAAATAGAAGVLLEGDFAAGSGHQIGNGSGIIGIGADNEDLRITCDDPAGGNIFVNFSYFTIES